MTRKIETTAGTGRPASLAMVGQPGRRGNPLWRPGQSGNPGGRPAVLREFRQRCRDFMETEGWDALEREARRHGRAGLMALELIASYAYGKPSQHVHLGGEALTVRVVYTDGALLGLAAGGADGEPAASGG